MCVKESKEGKEQRRARGAVEKGEEESIKTQ